MNSWLLELKLRDLRKNKFKRKRNFPPSSFLDMRLVQRKLLKWAELALTATYPPSFKPVPLPDPRRCLLRPSLLWGHHASHVFHSLSTSPELLRCRDQVLFTFASPKPSTVIATQWSLRPFLLSTIKIAIPSVLLVIYLHIMEGENITLKSFCTRNGINTLNSLSDLILFSPLLFVIQHFKPTAKVEITTLPYPTVPSLPQPSTPVR